MAESPSSLAWFGRSGDAAWLTSKPLLRRSGPGRFTVAREATSDWCHAYADLSGLEAQETPDRLLLFAPGVGEDDVLDVKVAGRNGSDFSGATARRPVWVSGTSSGRNIRRGTKPRRKTGDAGQALRRRRGR